MFPILRSYYGYNPIYKILSQALNFCPIFSYIACYKKDIIKEILIVFGKKCAIK